MSILGGLQALYEYQASVWDRFQRILAAFWQMEKAKGALYAGMIVAFCAMVKTMWNSVVALLQLVVDYLQEAGPVVQDLAAGVQTPTGGGVPAALAKLNYVFPLEEGLSILAGLVSLGIAMFMLRGLRFLIRLFTLGRAVV